MGRVEWKGTRTSYVSSLSLADTSLLLQRLTLDLRAYLDRQWVPSPLLTRLINHVDSLDEDDKEGWIVPSDVVSHIHT
jgi:hypothetical protein